MRYGDLLVNWSLSSVWPLDESGGLIARQYRGRNANPAAYAASGVTFGVTGPSAAIPRAITTDGVAGKVTLPALGGLATNAIPQTWCAWSYNASAITSASAASWIFGSGTSGVTPLALGSATGLLTNEVVSLANTDGHPDRRTGWTGFTIPAGWHFHVITYNGTQGGWRYYLDGIDITRMGGSIIHSVSGCVGFTSSATFTMGVTSGTAFSAVTVAAPAVFWCALTPAQIARMYQAGKAGATFGRWV